jgi:hypothetical protein
MGNVITVLLAVVIFGFGITMFIKEIKAETKGKCAGCSGDKSCCSPKEFKE